MARNNNQYDGSRDNRNNDFFNNSVERQNGLPSRSSLVTKSGIRPDDLNLPYLVSTNDVELYLQQKLDAAFAILKQNNPGVEFGKPVHLRVYTVEASQYFYPFVAVLPLSARASGKKDNLPSNSFFCTKSTDKTIKLKSYIYDVMKAYVYNRHDAEAFTSDNVRRTLGISRASSLNLKDMVTPKLSNMKDDNGNHVITFVFDPIRVFYDMLKIENDNRDFLVRPTHMKMKTLGCYDYTVSRTLKSKSGNSKDSANLVKELERKVRLGGGRQRN